MWKECSVYVYNNKSHAAKKIDVVFLFILNKLKNASNKVKPQSHLQCQIKID